MEWKDGDWFPPSPYILFLAVPYNEKCNISNEREYGQESTHTCVCGSMKNLMEMEDSLLLIFSQFLFNKNTFFL